MVLSQLETHALLIPMGKLTPSKWIRSRIECVCVCERVEGKWGEEAGREEGGESVVSMKIVLSNSKINKLHLQKNTLLL